MADNVLIEKWAEMLESEVSTVSDPKGVMAQLLENQHEYIVESETSQGDIAQYTPILVPAVRRVFPNLLANEIVGVQPLKQPSGLVFALRYVYGDGDGISSIDRGSVDANGTNRSTFGAPALFTTVGVLFSGSTLTATVSGSPIIFSNGATGVVNYAEPGRALIKFPTDAQAQLACVPGVSAVQAGGSQIVAGTTVIAGFQNEMGFNLIFKNFTGAMSTAESETKGANIKNVQVKIEKMQVTAMARRLKAEYTLETAQDLKAIHGLDAEKELINIMEYELVAELDRELIDLINSKATVTPTWVYGGAGVVSNTTTTGLTQADGRWEAEKIRTLYNRLLREANQVALTTRKGSANFIIASSNVVAALETLQGFMYASVPGQVKPTMGVAKVGTLDGRFTVYMDTFAFKDYITLGYKGSSQMDSGVIYCPYVPLQMQKVIDPVTFQPKIGFMTRDAICSNIWGTQNYYRTFAVDFTGSSFGGGYFNGNPFQPAW